MATCKHKWVFDKTASAPYSFQWWAILHCEHCGEVKHEVLWQ